MRRKSLILSDEERRHILALADDVAVPEIVLLRARIVLRSGSQSRQAIAKELGVSVQTVAKWQERYLTHGLAGLRDLPRSGKPRRFPREMVEALIRQTLARQHPLGEPWSVRSVAKAVGLSPATVGRTWRGLMNREREAKTASSLLR